MRLFILVSLFLLLNAGRSFAQDLRLHAIFTHNMVLQRETSVPIWGTAKAAEKINLSFRGQNLSTKADAAGKWEIKLPAQAAGGPYDLVFTWGKTGRKELKNVLFGDVWLCSGQSNMEWSVQSADNFLAEQAAAKDPLIRHVKIPNKFGGKVQDTLPALGWDVNSPEKVGNFTAVGYFFTRDLRKQQPNIPLGLINSSWGGTRLECWASMEGNGYKFLSDVDSYHSKEQFRKRSEVEKIHGPIPNESREMNGATPTLTSLDYADQDWRKMPLPSWFWGEARENFDGVLWLRKTLDLPASSLGGSLDLNLGYFSDAVQIWVNGVPVDTTSQASGKLRRFSVPAQVWKVGKNVISLRIYDQGGSCGTWTDSEGMYLQTACGKIDLSGEWKYKLFNFQYLSSQQFDTGPMLLYNYMIAPLHRFPIKGFLWYQGESNSWPMPGVFEYRQQLANMITDWRKKWGQGDLPFLVVQLTSNGALWEDPNQMSNWALLRESQAEAVKKVPNAAMAVILDVGNPKDVHPTDKQTVGHRLSLLARKMVYGEKDLAAESPSLEQAFFDGPEVRLRFKNASDGLMAKDRYGYLKGFVVAGEDKKFHWASARIVGNEVILKSDAVAKPLAVRYAWGQSPVEANLFGKNGLPVGSFRTDDWEIKP